jgi:hypothetical protein
MLPCEGNTWIAVSGKGWEKEGLTTQGTKNTEEPQFDTSGKQWGRYGGRIQAFRDVKNPRSNLFSPSVRFVLSVVEPDFIGSASADGMKTFHTEDTESTELRIE